jgi:hypothetical protein
MAQGRSSQIISMIQWIRTTRLSMKNSLSGEALQFGVAASAVQGYLAHKNPPPPS